MGDVMDFCNYLYNSFSLGLFVGMRDWEIKITHSDFTLWIQFVPNCSIGFDKNRISHDFSFEFVFVKFPPTVFLQIIPYNRDTKEMKLLWFL
jgi:hypothetical protein